MLGAPHGQVSDPPSRHEFIYVALRRSRPRPPRPVAHAPAAAANGRARLCPPREPRRPHTRRERRLRNRWCRRLGPQARLVPTVRSCIAEPHAIRAVSNHDGGSLIIPECVQDRSRLPSSVNGAQRASAAPDVAPAPARRSQPPPRHRQRSPPGSSVPSAAIVGARA